MTGASLLVSMHQSNRMAARKASCAPKALGDALGIDVHVNEPNSRRRGPGVDMAGRPDAGRPGVGKEHGVVVG